MTDAYDIEVPDLASPLAWDLETIAAPDAIKNLPEPKPRANLVDKAKIAKDIEEKRAKAIKEMPLNGNTALICACGFAALTTEGEPWSAALVYDPRSGEKEYLEALFDVLGEAKEYITFNGMRFDVPMLMRRCLVANLAPPLEVSTRKYDMPPRGNHYDLCQILTHYGAMAVGGFDQICKIVLGEGKPEGIDGSKVQEFWEAGKVDEIAAYAKDDAEKTLRLWQRASGIYFHAK